MKQRFREIPTRGEDRWGNQTSGVERRLIEEPSKLNQTFPPSRLELRGSTYQNMPDRKHFVRIWPDGREELA